MLATVITGAALLVLWGLVVLPVWWRLIRCLDRRRLARAERESASMVAHSGMPGRVTAGRSPVETGETAPSPLRQR